MFAAVIEDITINIYLNVLNCKQHFLIESTDGVSSPFGLPVIAIHTGCAYKGIATRTNGLVLEATLVHIYNGMDWLH